MKIGLYYRHPWETGGVEKTMYNRGKMLSKLGHEIVYIFEGVCSYKTLKKWSEIGKVIDVNYCDDEFDCVIYDSIYNSKKLNSKRNVQVFNGNVIDANDELEYGIQFDEYVTVSEECQRQLEEKYGMKSIVIPNIIDEKEIKEKMKEEYDIPKKKHNFVVVSRLDLMKGFGRLATVCKEIEKVTDDYQVVVVGSNLNFPQQEQIIKQQLAGHNVLFVGQQDNPYKYMYNADALIMLSDFESQCMVVPESLICGTPCLCTDFPNAVLTLDGTNGIVVKKDMSDFDVNKLLNLKKGFKYKYPLAQIQKLWESVIVPPERHNTFSVLVPNYNNSQYLEKCLQSILDQTYKNYEVIFIDDVSTDNSLEIATRFAKKFEDNKIPYTIEKLETKRLNGGSRNVGIMKTKNDYIVCIDSDDWFKNKYVFERLNNYINGEDVIFVGFDMLNETGVFAKDSPCHPNLDEAFRHETCAIWTKVVKASILKNCLFPEGTLAEDKVHHYRLMEMCKTFKNFQDQAIVWNRCNKNSVSTARNVEWEASCIKHLAEMYLFIKRTQNEEHRKFVENVFQQQIQNLSKGVFKQI